jgi:phosphoheptose isomerase
LFSACSTASAGNFSRKNFNAAFRISSPHNLCFIIGMAHLQKAIDEAVATFRDLTKLEAPLNRAAKIVLDCLKSGKKLLVCGNGGSASDATHFATEFLCRYREDRRPYPAISLTANGEFMTAVCNDYHADEIFARQVQGLGEKGDVLIALTTSGKSKNVLRAIEEAKRKGIKSICFLGRDGGFTKGAATVDLLVPGNLTVRIQEGQKLLYHVLCEIVEEQLPKK